MTEYNPLPGHHSRVAVTLALLIAGSGAGCLDNKLEDTGDAGVKRVFIAQTHDFANYMDWTTSEQNVMDDHGGVIGTTTVYLSETPDKDTHEFPIGAILVKTMKPVDSDDMTIHAMSKRGSGFNAKGALGWEYFELLLSKTDVPYILWRGETPPSGEMYQVLLGANNRSSGATPEGDCNSCHASGQDGLLGDSVLGLLNAQ
jgi:hypothetical protein